MTVMKAICKDCWKKYENKDFKSPGKFFFKLYMPLSVEIPTIKEKCDWCGKEEVLGYNSREDVISEEGWKKLKQKKGQKRGRTWI